MEKEVLARAKVLQSQIESINTKLEKVDAIIDNGASSIKQISVSGGGRSIELNNDSLKDEDYKHIFNNINLTALMLMKAHLTKLLFDREEEFKAL